MERAEQLENMYQNIASVIDNNDMFVVDNSKYPKLIVSSLYDNTIYELVITEVKE